MNFYGTKASMQSWKKIIETEMSKQCSAIMRLDDVRHAFSVEMSEADRDLLQKNHWYATEEGSDMPWNWRVSFME